MSGAVQYADRVIASDSMPSRFRTTAQIQQAGEKHLPLRWRSAPSRSGNGYHSHGLGLRKAAVAGIGLSVDPVQSAGLGTCVIAGIAIFLALRCKLPR